MHGAADAEPPTSIHEHSDTLQRLARLKGCDGPVRRGYQAPELNAAGNDAAIEELTLAHEGRPSASGALGAWIRYEFY